MHDGIEIHQVDAFTDEPFRGNPAAVCLLTAPAPDEWMSRVAAEMNLSETSFVRRLPEGDRFELRWFTPTVEVALCGHATLASAFVLWDRGWLDDDAPARFQTRSGELAAVRQGREIAMDFPARPVEPTTLAAPVAAALGVQARFCGRTTSACAGERDVLLELESEAAVLAARPEMTTLAGAEAGFIVTAAVERDGLDYVCRYFAPAYGVDEDPVTGAAHCALGPYWSERLGRASLAGAQVSARGGRVGIDMAGDRVTLIGQAVPITSGRLIATPSPGPHAGAALV
ncbi:MAG: PhzF family phenazine biosynthesis protein [Planctomycetota bacterium]|jgi:PhzF family phenazine biosynthesis protein